MGLLLGSEFPNNLIGKQGNLAVAATFQISEAESRCLASYLNQNATVWHLLETLPQLPVEAWLAAGCIMQTVWNIQLGRPPATGIRDFDVIYFDAEDLSWEAEDNLIQSAQKLWPDLEVELRNQARVHLWYPDKFGVEIAPLNSLEAALHLWPATCHAIAVRKTQSGLQVLAPWGLEDLWSGQLRANPNCPDESAYEKKVKRWLESWPHLNKFIAI